MLSEIPAATSFPIFAPMGVQEQSSLPLWASSPASLRKTSGWYVELPLRHYHACKAEEEKAADGAARFEEAAPEERRLSPSDTPSTSCFDHLGKHRGLGDSLADPMGIRVGDLSITARWLGSEFCRAFDTIKIRFDSQSAAFLRCLHSGSAFTPPAALLLLPFTVVGAALDALLAPGARCSAHTSAVIFYRAVNFQRLRRSFATVAIIILTPPSSACFWMKTFAKKEDDNTQKVIPIPIQPINRPKVSGVHASLRRIIL